MTINGVSTCAEAGTEKYERFQSGIGRRRRTLVQYDYRHPIDRELFSCVKPTLDGAAIEQARKQLENAQKFEGSPLEKKMNVLMGQIGIDYSKLTKEEQMTLLRVFNKSSMLKHRTKAGMRGKHRR